MATYRVCLKKPDGTSKACQTESFTLFVKMIVRALERGEYVCSVGPEGTGEALKRMGVFIPEQVPVLS